MKYIEVYMRYRSANNDKDYGEFYYPNKTGLTVEELEEVFICDNPYIVQAYGLESIAPYNPEDYWPGGDDHSYCEIAEFKEAVLVGKEQHQCGVMTTDIAEIYDRKVEDDRTGGKLEAKYWKDAGKYCNA